MPSDGVTTILHPLPAAGPTDIAAALEIVLARFLAREAAAVTELDPLLEPLGRAARDAVLGGGKRLRPTFAYWGWRGLAGPDEDADDVMPAFAALEILHAFALVHDDVMDRAALRRGRPTARRVFAGSYHGTGSAGDAGQFGDSAAILVGDLCLVWADRMFGRARLTPAASAAARQVYDHMRVEAVSGQFLDLLGESAAEWSLDQAIRTARMKTATYTVMRPLIYGACLTGATTGERGGPYGDVIRAYTHYGLAVGEAFQLRDDLLGLYGEPSVTGKPAGDDVTAAKPTVLLQCARAMATPRQASELSAALVDAGPDHMQRVAALIDQIGAKRQVEVMIADRIAMAGAALAGATLDAGVEYALRNLAAAAAWRSA